MNNSNSRNAESNQEKNEKNTSGDIGDIRKQAKNVMLSPSKGTENIDNMAETRQIEFTDKEEQYDQMMSLLHLIIMTLSDYEKQGGITEDISRGLSLFERMLIDYLK